MLDRYQQALELLAQRGQGHLLRWWDELSPSQREGLLSQIESIPWETVAPLVETHVLARPEIAAAQDIAPPPVYPAHPGPEHEALYREATKLGREVLRAGKVAAFTVAGGQGTRLGYDGPKGGVVVTPISGHSLFELFADMLHAANARHSVTIPWYIMTSPANHRATVDIFERENYFGLDAGRVVFFEQAMLPMFSFEGRILMTSKHELALGPDGHGGSLKALAEHGVLKRMRTEGVEIISYFQVDNPLVKPFDPLFLGLYVKTGAEMAVKVLRKVDDLERMGNVCLCDGKIAVIEYTDFPEMLAHQKNPDGSRRFDSGNAAIHLFDVGFVDRIVGQTFELPYRRADKAVPSLGDDGKPMKPTEPNAVKLETFVFDALPLARSPLVLEVDRAEEFSPVKNADGSDSLTTAKRDQIRRACRWLEAAGVAAPTGDDGEPTVAVEISPLFALESEDVRSRRSDIPPIEPGQDVYIH